MHPIILYCPYHLFISLLLLKHPFVDLDALEKQDILAVAYQIAQTASAPPPGSDVSRANRPPYPLESDMRCSKLFQMGVEGELKMDVGDEEHVRIVGGVEGEMKQDDNNRRSHVTEVLGFGSSLLDLDLNPDLE